MAKTGKLILCQRFNQTISSAFPSVTFDNPKSWQPLNLRNPWSSGSPVEQRFPRLSIEIRAALRRKAHALSTSSSADGGSGLSTGVRRRPGWVAEEQSLHLRVRRVLSADLGDRRHDHARQQAVADDLVLG